MYYASVPIIPPPSPLNGHAPRRSSDFLMLTYRHGQSRLLLWEPPMTFVLLLSITILYLFFNYKYMIKSKKLKFCANIYAFFVKINKKQKKRANFLDSLNTFITVYSNLTYQQRVCMRQSFFPKHRL